MVLIMYHNKPVLSYSWFYTLTMTTTWCGIPLRRHRLHNADEFLKGHVSETFQNNILLSHQEFNFTCQDNSRSKNLPMMTGLSRRVSVSVSVFKRQQRTERVFYLRETITFCQRRENISLLPAAAVQCVFTAGFTTCSVWITPYYYCSYQPAKACLIVLTCSVCFNFNILEICASIIGYIIIYFLSVLQSKKLSRVSMEPLLGNF